MRKTGFFLLQLACLWTVHAYAEDTTNGYIISIYGSALKSTYGECVHTAYYDPDTDSRAECGDQKEVASAPVAESPKVVVETVTISDADQILFNFNAATLTAQGIAEITGFAKKLVGAQSDITGVIIDGYTDSIGANDYNLKLSLERANTVKQFFIQNGISAQIITTHGYGEKNTPVTAGCISKYGNDDMSQIWQLENKLNAKKYKGKDVRMIKEKKRLQDQLHELKAKRNNLIACAAPDRRVVFTIEHSKQVEKTVTDDASAPVSGQTNKPASQ